MINTVMLADGMYIAANRLASLSGFALEEAKAVDAQRIIDAVAHLDTAVELAIERDKRDSWDAWEEIKSLFEHGLFGYWRDRRDFETRGEQEIQKFRNALKEIDTMAQGVDKQAGHVPGDLEADSAAWSSAADTVGQIRGRISAMQHIPGWQGTASGGYTNRTIVQDGATQELRGMAASLSNAFNQMALFNRALFLFMEREIKSATTAVNALQGSDGWHFVRSINGSRLLGRLRSNLEEALSGEPVKAVSDSLQSMVTECLQTPQLLEPGAWPTGGARASVPPAATDSVPDPDRESRVEDPTTHRPPTVGEDGLLRNEPWP